MAKCDMKMPEDFLLKISKLGSNFDSVAVTFCRPVARWC